MSVNRRAIVKAVRTASTVKEVAKAASQLGVVGFINTKLVFVGYVGAWEFS